MEGFHVEKAVWIKRYSTASLGICGVATGTRGIRKMAQLPHQEMQYVSWRWWQLNFFMDISGQLSFRAIIISYEHFPRNSWNRWKEFLCYEKAAQRKPEFCDLFLQLHHARCWDHIFFGSHVSIPEVCAYVWDILADVWRAGVARLAAKYYSCLPFENFPVDQDAQNT